LASEKNPGMTPETKKVKSAMGEQVTFLTIVTANSHNYNDHATVSTARQWSDQHFAHHKKKAIFRLGSLPPMDLHGIASKFSSAD
jgi:hypothetical protein